MNSSLPVLNSQFLFPLDRFMQAVGGGQCGCRAHGHTTSSPKLIRILKGSKLFLHFPFCAGKKIIRRGKEGRKDLSLQGKHESETGRNCPAPLPQSQPLHGSSVHADVLVARPAHLHQLHHVGVVQLLQDGNFLVDLLDGPLGLHAAL